MQLAGGDNYIQAATDADKRMGTDTAPLNVYSERCGGTARRAQLKRKASEITRSACMKHLPTALREHLPLKTLQ